jgi:hypothetical protein
MSLLEEAMGRYMFGMSSPVNSSKPFQAIRRASCPSTGVSLVSCHAIAKAVSCSGVS